MVLTCSLGILIISEAVRPGVAGKSVPVADFVAAARSVAAAGDSELATSVLWTAASRCWWTSAQLSDRLAVAGAIEELDLTVTDPRRIAILSYTVTREHSLSCAGTCCRPVLASST